MPLDKKTISDINSKLKNNEVDIVSSQEACCVFCRSHFSAREVSDWNTSDTEVTALCPRCGMPAVLGDATGYLLSHQELREANLSIYGLDFMKTHPDAMYTYLERYFGGKISKKKGNEDLAIRYLEMLEEQEEPEAAFRLGLLYAGGADFLKPDLHEAHKHLSRKCLWGDPGALTHRGFIGMLLADEDSKHEKKMREEAFMDFCKAAALGGTMARIFISDCYYHGMGVRQDTYLGMQILYTLFAEQYPWFYASRGSDARDIGAICFRIGNSYESEGDYEGALHFYLIADLAFRFQKESDPDSFLFFGEKDELEKRLEEVARHQGYKTADPIFDESTFYASFQYGDEAPFVKANPDGLPKHFLDAVYNEDESTISFTMCGSKQAPLIIDTQSLFCDFVEGPIRWTFSGVEMAKYVRAGHFDTVKGTFKDCIILSGEKNEERYDPMTVFFYETDAPSEEETEEEKEEIKKEGPKKPLA